MIPEPLAQFPKICWTGETAVCSQMLTPRWVTAHSIFLVMDCSHKTVPIPSDIPSVFDALDQGIFGVFFSLTFWFPLGLKRFAPSSFSGCSWSCMKGAQLFRDAFKEASCEPSFAFLATSFLTCCFYFWPTPCQMTLTGSQMLHIKTRGICSSWEPLVLAVSSPASTHTEHWEFQCTKLSSALDLYFQGKITRHWKAQEAS